MTFQVKKSPLALGYFYGTLIFIHLQCWEVLRFCRFQRQRCIKIRVLRAQDFYTPLALKTAKGQHLPALEVYKNQSPILGLPWGRPQQSLLSTPNMTGRRFHRTMEMIPALPWWSKSPSVSTPVEQSRKQGDARGASEVRRGTSSNHFHCPVPRSSSHIGLNFQRFRKGVGGRGLATNKPPKTARKIVQKYVPLLLSGHRKKGTEKRPQSLA